MPDTGASARNGLHLASLKNQPNPLPFYAKLLEPHPVCRVEPGGLWAVSRYDDVCFAEKRYDRFSASGDMELFHPRWLKLDYVRDLFLGAQDPPVHTKRRALVNPAFAGKAISALKPKIEEMARSLVGNIRPGCPIEFVTEIAYPYVGAASRQMTGLDEEEIPEQLKRWVSLNEDNLCADDDPDERYISSVRQAVLKQNERLCEAIDRRRGRPGPGLISALVHAEMDGQKLDDDVLLNAVEQMLVGGLHPPAQLLCQSIRNLSRRPDLLVLLLDNTDLIPAFVEEVLRYESIGPAQLRRTVDDVTLSGVTIPKGDLVLVFLGAANHDPRQFPNPDSFDIFRPNLKKHLGFGIGPHLCIGAALARLQAAALLEAILQRFTRISCPDDQDLEWNTSWLMRSICALPVTFN